MFEKYIAISIRANQFNDPKLHFFDNPGFSGTRYWEIIKIQDHEEVMRVLKNVYTFIEETQNEYADVKYSLYFKLETLEKSLYFKDFSSLNTYLYEQNYTNALFQPQNSLCIEMN